MYIKKLSITGYRCFSELFEINFRKGLNVIVGENGAGKTAIINSFRQLFIDTESGSYNVSSDDFNKPFKEASIAADSFQIKVEFDNLENAEPIAFLQWSDATNNVILNLEVLNKELRGRFKKSFWGGNSKSSQFDIELFDKIHCIYLPPLRDAESKLVNGRQSRLSKLLKFIEAEQLKTCKKAKKKHPLEEKFKDFNKSLIEEEGSSIKEANRLITEHLLKAVGQNFSQSTHIQFVENEFSKIVENLRLIFFPKITTAEADQFRDLCQNSLGYNNLLYIASILAELTLTKEESLYRLLLIEEPEAHLHPQLQVRLLDHLEKVANEHKVQVIVTTHSTVLASSVHLDKIIHLTKNDNPTATPLAECGLADNNLNFLNRWLDITKSNLLFASGVILVEGIAEQMIIPELAKTVLKDKEINNIEDYGVSVINLNGIYFNHFMRLYCNITGVPDVQEDQVGLNVPIRCAGITDLDPDQFYYEEDTSTDTESKDKPEKKIKIDYKPHEDNILEGKNHALKLVDSINTSDFARLFVAKFKTLEYDLAMESNNAKEMAKVLIELWPSKTGDVKNGLQVIIDDDYSKITSEQKANHAFEILKRVDDKNIGKGYFAQVLADKISSEEIKLQVPQYLEDAILWACSLDKSSIQE
ncbi:AAA family ATPase [Acinetobacter baumannii]|uniref:ATP-dependent nuclease n=2 Tax=Acinetobacter calcoaceticus/baumannii complex TaxID=909768 RepID=UPI000529B3B9|nr:AAA family ATPase [Acinetobacter baumannii]MCE6137932.1 AAA family ATPase [Acinetobacter baumannii]MCE6626362.1 AAA family ATPase [Acinetobacter baumannii]MCE6641274.1 AAA family ATPase [Acinetobacter baumannii]MCG5759919.1 AAA family ATPase [Acinetobacter baumannii]MCG5811320.1 AAA family ATPase [Acinetobacter baumannii]